MFPFCPPTPQSVVSLQCKHAQANLASQVHCSVVFITATEIKMVHYYWIYVCTAVFNFTEPLSVAPLTPAVPVTMAIGGKGE